MSQAFLVGLVCSFALLSSRLLAREKVVAQEDAAAAPKRIQPGARPDGRIQLPTQWSLRPVGKQVPLGDFPVNIAVHPKQEHAAILHAGYGEHEVIVVDLENERIVSRVTVPQAFYGITFDHAGEQLFVSGGEHEVVHRFRYQDGFLS